MKTVINKIQLAYDDVGDGPPVLLIHGFPLCRKMWTPQAESLTAAGFRVITPDLRGFGESELGQGLPDMDSYADDIIGLMDFLGLETVLVGGMSMGGYVTLNLLDRFFSRIKAAMFIVTRSEADNPDGKATRTRLAASVEAGDRDAPVDFFEEILFAETTPTENPQLVKQVRGWMSATQPSGLIGGLLAMRERKDYSNQLDRFQLPVMVIGAEEDRCISPDSSKWMGKFFLESTLHIIPGAGHMANLEKPKVFNRHLLDFLQTVSP